MKLLNEILGTKYPIIQGGMANIATGEFAAACSNAGALGLIGSGILYATTLLCGLPFGFLESTLFLLMVAIGMILPTSTALALDIEREHSGSASAVIGFFQFLSGAIVSPLTGLGDILLLTGLLTVCCSVVSLCFGALACRPSRN